MMIPTSTIRPRPLWSQLQQLGLFGGFLLMGIAPSALGAPSLLPPPHHATYTVTVDGITLGEMKRSLQKEGEGWQLSSEIYTTGLWAALRDERRTESSRFQIDGAGLKRLDYQFWKRSRGKEKRATLTQLADGTALSRVNDQEYRFPEGAAYHDLLSYQWQMQREALAGQREFSYRLIDEDEIKEYRFKVIESETLTLPQGEVKTLHIKRIDNPKRQVEFWVAIDWAFLMVKISHTQDRYTFTSTLTELK